ncbi:hypothetical protein [Streptomyces sp. 061-3]|uniref:hypothetical protein n=1 Tax=Streptomyces sp. 061-3 TaxID=2789268 RepID=UPI0039801EC9
MPAAPTSWLRQGRADRKAGRDQEQAIDVATVEQTRRVFEAAAKMVAKLQDAGRRRFFAGQPRGPRSRQNRIGNAAVRRDARALSRVRRSNAWPW